MPWAGGDVAGYAASKPKSPARRVWPRAAAEALPSLGQRQRRWVTSSRATPVRGQPPVVRGRVRELPAPRRPRRRCRRGYVAGDDVPPRAGRCRALRRRGAGLRLGSLGRRLRRHQRAPRRPGGEHAVVAHEGDLRWGQEGGEPGHEFHRRHHAVGAPPAGDLHAVGDSAVAQHLDPVERERGPRAVAHEALAPLDIGIMRSATYRRTRARATPRSPSSSSSHPGGAAHQFGGALTFTGIVLPAPSGFPIDSEGEAGRTVGSSGWFGGPDARLQAAVLSLTWGRRERLLVHR